MKTSSRILSMSLVALVAFTFASKTFAFTFQKIEFKNTVDGTITVVAVDENGNFATPPMPAGKYTYSWSLVSKPTGSSAQLNSDGSAMPSSTDGGTGTATIGGPKRGISLATSPSADRESSPPSVSEVVVSYTIQSPRDLASGQSVGKQRMHKPFMITKELDKSTPLLATSLGAVETNAAGESITGTVSFKSKDGTTIRKPQFDLIIVK